MASPLDFKHYREFIAAELESDRYERGAKMRLAEHLGVQRSFVSAVLGGRQEFSPEHILKVAQFMGLDPEDRKCLLLLLNRDRAGSADLAQHYQEEIQRIRDERNRIKAQIKAKSELTEADYADYAKAWYHSAVNTCLRIPALRDVDSIARYLKVGRAEVSSSLKMLQAIGFAKLVKGKWQPAVTRFHFSKDGLALRKYHANWRHMAVHALDAISTENLHYSMVMSIDRGTFDKIRAMALAMIRDSEPLIAKAEDQEVVAMTLDLFKLANT